MLRLLLNILVNISDSTKYINKERKLDEKREKLLKYEDTARITP